MKINLIVLAFISISVCLLSCEKTYPFDSSILNQNPANPVALSQVRLAKIYEIDTTLTAPADTSYKEVYTYDVLNRIIKKTIIDFSTNGDSGYIANTRYFYTGTDTLAQKIYEDHKFFATPVITGRDSVFYNYANNKIIKDSLTSSDNYYNAQTYTYNTNYIYRTIREVNTVPPVYISFGSSKIYQTKTGNNITSQTDTTVTNTNTSPGITEYSRYSAAVSYLNNPNPFYAIARATKRNYLSDDLGLAGDAAPEKLILQQKYTLTNWTNSSPPSVLDNSQIDYTYTFRSDDFPISARAIIMDNGIIKKTKLLFVYQ